MKKFRANTDLLANLLIDHNIHEGTGNLDATIFCYQLLKPQCLKRLLNIRFTSGNLMLTTRTERQPGVNHALRNEFPNLMVSKQQDEGDCFDGSCQQAQQLGNGALLSLEEWFSSGQSKV